MPSSTAVFANVLSFPPSEVTGRLLHVTGRRIHDLRYSHCPLFARKVPTDMTSSVRPRFLFLPLPATSLGAFFATSIQALPLPFRCVPFPFPDILTCTACDHITFRVLTCVSSVTAFAFESPHDGGSRIRLHVHVLASPAHLPHRALPRMPTGRRKKPPPPSLEETRSILRQRQRALTDEIRALKQQSRRLQRNRTGEHVGKFFRNVLVALVFLANYKTDLAVGYWQDARRRKHLPVLDVSDMKERIDDLFLQCDVDHFADLAWGDGATTERHNPFWRAWRWKVKMDVRAWVDEVNMRQGLAPSSSMVARRMNTLGTHPVFRLNVLEDPKTSGAARVRLQRWRGQAGARWKAIRVKERITLEEKRQKARGANNSPPK